jgi:hypothetical protein
MQLNKELLRSKKTLTTVLMENDYLRSKLELNEKLTKRLLKNENTGKVQFGSLKLNYNNNDYLTSPKIKTISL